MREEERGKKMIWCITKMKVIRYQNGAQWIKSEEKRYIEVAPNNDLYKYKEKLHQLANKNTQDA
jgi:hypothetical protein